MNESGIRLTSGTLRQAAVISAQALLVFLALWALRSTAKHLSYVLIPLAVALLLTALLEPMVSWLVRHRWRRSLAVLVTLITGLITVGGLVTFVVVSVLNNFDELRLRVSEGLAQLQEWLSYGPLQIQGGLLDRAQQWLSSNQQELMSRAVGAFNTAGVFIAGVLIAAVLFIMFLSDGPKMWSFLLRPWSPQIRDTMDDAGRRAFRSVVLYVRVTALVALIDAVGIGIGLAIVGVPLTIPLTALVFLGGFIPYVGAIVSGFLAVAITLVSNGLVPALIILGVVLLVQQLESQVLQPILQGNFTHLHPAVVLVALIIGAAEGGIAGVLFAVPVLAAARGVVLAVVEQRERRTHEAQDSAKGQNRPAGQKEDNSGNQRPDGEGS